MITAAEANKLIKERIAEEFIEEHDIEDKIIRACRNKENSITSLLDGTRTEEQYISIKRYLENFGYSCTMISKHNGIDNYIKVEG